MTTFSVELSTSNNWQTLTARDCLIVFASHDEKAVTLSPQAVEFDARSDGSLQRLVKNKQITGKKAQVDMIHQPFGIPASGLIVLGLGETRHLGHSDLTGAIAALYQFLNQRHIARASLSLDDFTTLFGLSADTLAKSLAQTWYEVFYRYDQTLSKHSEAISFESLTLHTKSAGETLKRSIRVGQAVGKATQLTKTLGNLPGNICTPSYLESEAQRLGKELGFTTSSLDEAKMKKLKMNSLLSVSRGSREPAKLITMEYKNGEKNSAPIVLVGKGLTFDAGGISLKPAGDMDEMKYDMCGGATVFGVMQAVAELELPINLVGIVPSSENLPDGAANKPGDIVTSMNGTTIEILNTDAEGRLILCDALTYAERYKPAAVIDIATLTGACMVALGKQTSGLFSNDDDLAAQLQQAGENAFDRAWRLPVWDDYQTQLKSNFADVANIGGRFAGAITAACFLKRFADNFKWAHLDIAGTAWKSGAKKGATGRPVPLLVEFLLNFKP